MAYPARPTQNQDPWFTTRETYDAAIEAAVTRVDPGVAGTNGQVLGIVGGVPGWLERPYTVLGSTSTQADLQAALTAGDPIWLDADITVTSELTATTDVVLHGPGTVLYPAASRALKIDGTWGTAHTITAIATVVYPVGEGSVSRISTANAASYAAGDVVMIYSSDEISAVTGSSWAGATRAELMSVIATDASYVYLAGILKDTYTTTPMITKHPKLKVDIDGPTFRGNGDITATVTTRADSALWVSGAAYSHIRCHFENGWSRGLWEVSGWTNDIDITADHLRDDAANSAQGYAYSTLGATRHSRVAVAAHRCRCATQSNTSNPNSTAQRGGARDITVHDSIAVSCTAASFGTHPGAYNWTYTNCHVYTPYAVDAPAEAFGTQGANMTFEDCWLHGPGRFLRDSSSQWNHGVPSITRVKGGGAVETDAEAAAFPTDAFWRTANTTGNCQLVVRDFLIQNKSVQFDTSTQLATFINCEFRNTPNIYIHTGGHAKIINCYRIWNKAGSCSPIKLLSATLELVNYTVEGAHGGNFLISTDAGTTPTLRAANINSLTPANVLRETLEGTWTVTDAAMAVS